MMLRHSCFALNTLGALLTLVAGFLGMTSSMAPQCTHAPSIHIDGLVIVGGLFNVHTTGPGGVGCGPDIDPDAVQRLEAFLFTVDLLNKQDFVPGITFGAYAYDTCGQSHRAVRSALDFLARREANSYGNSCNLWPLFAGVVGPLLSEPAMQVASLLTSANIAQISYGARTAQLSDKDAYPYFLRTIPSGAHVAQVLVDIIKELDWQDVVIVTGDDMYARELRQQLLEVGGKEEVCVTKVIELDNDRGVGEESIMELAELPDLGISGVILLTMPELTLDFFSTVDRVADFFYPQLRDLAWISGLPFHESSHYTNLTNTIRGLITVQEYGSTVKGFRDYFLNQTPDSNSRNPWFVEYWEQVHNCTVGKTCSSRHPFLHARNYKQALYVPQVVSSLFSYAHALKTAQELLCNGTATPCPALSSLSTDRLSTYLKDILFVNLDNTIVSFAENGDFANPSYAVMNLQVDRFSYRLNTVGKWSQRKGLKMTSTFKMYSRQGQGLTEYPKSFCYQDACQCQNNMGDNSIGRQDDFDLQLVGLFDIHGNYEGENRCDYSEFHEETVQAVEAMYYAIDVINNSPDVLPGVKLGGIAIDTCRNPTRTTRHLLDVMHETTLGHARSKTLPIGGIIGPATSRVAMATSEISKLYKLPQISYSISNPKLRNRKKYPHFLRTVGSDEAEARVIVDILTHFNWTYVIVMFSDNEDNNAAVREFLRLADSEGICVATQVKLETYFAKDRTAMGNIAKFYLLEGFPKANTVVLFTTERDTTSLFHATRLHSTSSTGKRLTWVGSTSWGTRQSVVQGNEDLAAGAVTVAQYSQPVLPFMEYFQRIRPGDDEARNPWFAEYWQHTFGCHLKSKHRHRHNTSCDPRWTLRNEKIKMSEHVPYVINAVYSVALGIHKLVSQYCGGRITWPACNKAAANMAELTKYIREVDFYNAITNFTVTYDMLGEAVPRYKIYNFRKEHSVYSYVEIGSWSQNQLHLATRSVLQPARNGTWLPFSDVTSTCADCLCSSSRLTDIGFQMKYARLALLGFFPIHHTGSHGGACGPIRSKGGFLQYMAFKYAIQRVNEDPNILHNVTLGYIVLDTCSDPDNADMVFDAFDKALRFFTQPPQVPGITYINAFIGGFDDDVTASLNMASQSGQRLVQISPHAATDDFDDGDKYPYLLRTSATDSDRFAAVVDLLRVMGWTYVSVIHGNSPGAHSTARRLEQYLSLETICVASTQSIDEQNGQVTGYLAAVQLLVSQQGARVVILLVEKTETLDLLFEASKIIGTKLAWIGFEALLEVSATADQGLTGSFALAPEAARDPYFEDYLRRMKLSTDDGKSWVSEFWQEYFQCDVEYREGGQHSKACTGQELQLLHTDHLQESVVNTINAVYSFAYGLTQLFKDRCGEVRVPPCDAIRLDERINHVVYQYIKKTRFVGADNQPFAYSERGTGPARFLVFNHQMSDTVGGLGRGFVQVGSWSGGNLSLNQSLLQPPTEATGELIKSECPGLCNCSFHDVHPDTSKAPVLFKASETVWGILVITLSSLGITFSLVTIIFFISKAKHPVVLGSSCSLSVMLLLGIILMYLLNFAFMFSPTLVTCGVRRLGLGLFYSIVFSCLLVKTARINGIYSKVSPYFMSGSSQTIAALLLVLIELILVVEWLIVQPPSLHWHTTVSNPNSRFPTYHVTWYCSHTGAALVASMVYIYILVIVTLVSAVKAREAAGFHKEALTILVTSGGTVIILVCWLLVYIFAGDSCKEPAVCLGLTANASLVLTVMFFPKMLELTTKHPIRRQGGQAGAMTASKCSTADGPPHRECGPQHKAVDEHVNQAYECRELDHNPVYDNYNGYDGRY